ncbi:hypothetical protein [Cohnella soli]|uniref:Uncharacterized protein n=1 Tax=Cohnella soli TaxID=425005 RepID=A0ABW0HRT6_9BACL
MTSVNDTKVKLSQWEALLLESLRSLGWSDEELLRRVPAGDNLPKDESDFEFDYEALASFARQEPEIYESAVKNGYQIKYNTIRGIRSWILVALGVTAELSLDEGNEYATAPLSDAQRNRLEGVLSHGWSLEAAEAPGLYRIVPSRA